MRTPWALVKGMRQGLKSAARVTGGWRFSFPGILWLWDYD